MRRAVTMMVLACLLAGSAQTARSQPVDEPVEADEPGAAQTSPPSSSARQGDEPVEADEPGAADETAATELPSRELGVVLGLGIGGGQSTPGGLRLGGNYLYRLSDIDWFEVQIDVTVGSGDAVCFTDRDGETACSPGPIGGRAVQVSGGVRRYLKPEELFTPYAQLGVGVRVVSWPGDNLRGLVIPVTGGFGIRAMAHERVRITGESALSAGLGLFGGGLGVETQLGLAVQVRVELSLD